MNSSLTRILVAAALLGGAVVAQEQPSAGAELLAMKGAPEKTSLEPPLDDRCLR